MRTIDIKAGEKTRIIRKISNSMAAKYQFSVEPAVAGGEVSGKVEIAGSSWILSKAPVQQDLQTNNEVSKGMWDTFYSVYVIPDQDVTVSLTGGQLSSKIIYLALVAVVVAVAGALMTVGLGK